jgi:N utilization substance protein A
MNHELLAVLEYIEQERGISKEQLVNAVEKALAATCQKHLERRAKNVEAKLNRSNGSVRVVAIYDVVDAIDTYIDTNLLELSLNCLKESEKYTFDRFSKNLLNIISK